MNKTIIKNKFPLSDYEMIDTFYAGIELKGWEVKSIRKNNVNLKNSFCSFKKNELFISNMHVSKWMLENNEEFRVRKLLLHKSELIKIKEKIERLKCTIIPLKLYWENNKIKIEISIVRKRNKFDKRQKIKEIEIEKKLNNLKKY